MLIALLLGADGGCARDGTAVGNPGPTKPPSSMDDGLLRIVAQAPPDGVTLSQAELAVTDIALLACSGDDDLTEVSAILDVLEGEAFALTGGSWCGLTVSLEVDALVLTGSTDSGTGFTATLDPTMLSSEGAFNVDGQTVTLTLPTDFLDASAIESASEQESTVVIGTGSELGTEWTDALVEGTTPTGLEDDEGSPELAGTDESKDCGYVSGGVGGWWLFVALVALIRRRSILS